jgi:hypothetical protein
MPSTQHINTRLYFDKEYPTVFSSLLAIVRLQLK